MSMAAPPKVVNFASLDFVKAVQKDMIQDMPAPADPNSLINDGVTATGQSGVTKDIPGGLILSGTPAHPHREEMRRQVLFKQLPQFVKRVKALEEKLG